MITKAYNNAKALIRENFNKDFGIKKLESKNAEFV